MTRLASSPKGYPEWATSLVEERLSDAARKRWQDIAIRTVPPPSIEVENLTVRFYKDFAHAKHFMSLLRGGSETFNVIDGVSFRAYPGDVVGIIGHNGAGKSSLLQTIAGLIPIKNGLIRVKENFMLLRGGIGIQPHLSGRENVLSAGIYLDLRRLRRRENSRYPGVLRTRRGLRPADQIPYSDGMLSRLVFCHRRPACRRKSCCWTSCWARATSAFRRRPAPARRLSGVATGRGGRDPFYRLRAQQLQQGAGDGPGQAALFWRASDGGFGVFEQSAHVARTQERGTRF